MKIRTFLLTGATPIAIGVVAGIYSFTLISSPWIVNAKEAKITWDQPKSKHSGTFTGLNATIDLDPLTPGTAVINATIDATTLNTANEKRDAHLKSVEFFDVEKHPLISFTSEKVVKTDAGFVATGKLSLRDSVRTIDIPFQMIESPAGSLLKGTMTIFSGDYGVGKKSVDGKDSTIVTIEVPVTKPN
ncbi:MAG TPA: YceI family protein [Bacteroidia bacterium]|nr:YceI family protein [Bacteroidia bacterium]